MKQLAKVGWIGYFRLCVRHFEDVYDVGKATVRPSSYDEFQLESDSVPNVKPSAPAADEQWGAFQAATVGMDGNAPCGEFIWVSCRGRYGHWQGCAREPSRRERDLVSMSASL